MKVGDLIRIDVWVSETETKQAIGMILCGCLLSNSSDYFTVQIGEHQVPVHISRIVEVISESK